MVKIKEQLAGVAALIGVLGAIGAGFIKYGEVMSKLDSLEAFNPDPMMIVIGDNKKDIAVLQKTIQILELAQELEEYGKVEQLPVLEGKKMIMFVSPKKAKKK